MANPAVPTDRSRPSRGRLRKDRFPLLALTPLLVALVLLTLYPAAQLVRMAFSDVGLVSGGTTWSFVGLEHLRTLAGDRVARIAFTNTLIFTVVVVPIEAVLGLLLAYLVNQTRVLGTFYKTVFIVPLLLPPIAIGALWRLMLDYNYGVVNQALLAFGIGGPPWLASPTLALPMVMLVDVWHWTSFMFLIFLAGVSSIPLELGEAAEVDGASPWQVFRYVVLPILKPTIVVALMMRTILAFKVFDQIYLLTGGGPGTATEVISFTIYRRFFTEDQAGYGAAISIATFVFIAVLIALASRFNKR